MIHRAFIRPIRLRHLTTSEGNVKNKIVSPNHKYSNTHAKGLLLPSGT